MSLLTDLRDHFDSVGYYEEPHSNDLECVLVEDEVIDIGRWSIARRAVFHRKTIVGREPIEFSDEYVAVEYDEPATELQDWDDFGVPEVYNVWPVEVSVTKFIKEK